LIGNYAEQSMTSPCSSSASIAVSVISTITGGADIDSGHQQAPRTHPLQPSHPTKSHQQTSAQLTVHSGYSQDLKNTNNSVPGFKA
jgi:hypothetical protein